MTRRRAARSLEAAIAPLAARVCMGCAGVGVQVVSPGVAEVRDAASGILLAAGRGDVSVCLRCAETIGWPWASQRATAKRRGFRP